MIATECARNDHFVDVTRSVLAHFEIENVRFDVAVKFVKLFLIGTTL